MEVLKEMPDYASRFFDIIEDPVALLNTFIMELVEDCAFTLSVPCLPDEDDFDS